MSYSITRLIIYVDLLIHCIYIDNICWFAYSLQKPCDIFTDEEVEVKRGLVICAKLHNWSNTESGFKSKSISVYSPQSFRFIMLWSIEKGLQNICMVALTSMAYIRKDGVDSELTEWPRFAEGIREHSFFSSLKLKLFIIWIIRSLQRGKVVGKEKSIYLCK